MASTAEPTSAAAEPSRGLSLLVVIPALDEEPTVASVIRGIPRDLPGVAGVAVLVVDDGSSDGTGAAAEEAGAHVIRHESPRGVGAAFGTALRHAIDVGADLIVSIDADGQFDPTDIAALDRARVAAAAPTSPARRASLDPALVPRDALHQALGQPGDERGSISRLTGQQFARRLLRHALLQPQARR